MFQQRNVAEVLSVPSRDSEPVWKNADPSAQTINPLFIHPDWKSRNERFVQFPLVHREKPVDKSVDNAEVSEEEDSDDEDCYLFVDMKGGVMYEAPAVHGNGDWSRDGARMGNSDRSGPSPSHSHISVGSPYHMDQSLPGPGYAVNYHTARGPTTKYPPPPAFYNHDGYQVASSSRHKLGQGYPSQLAPPAPLLTTASLRSYDSTIPQYYPITSEPRREGVQKRKRAHHTPPSLDTPIDTPRRSQSQEDVFTCERKSKRKRVAKDTSQPPSQLPTPPSTGREAPTTLSNRSLSVGPEDTPQVPRRKGVVVVKRQGEGRKLGLIGVAGGEEDNSFEESMTSPRTATMPSLTTDSSGLATVTNQEVLETEVAWIENGGRVRTPPSSSIAQLQTPPMAHVTMGEPSDSPATALEKMTKRLELFKEDDKIVEEPMVSTRIEMFGRVAVNKTFAVHFLGLDSSAPVIEETQSDVDDGWSVTGVARSLVRPQWPDHESPWALAGSKRKEKLRKETEARVLTLKRYLESASDEGSDNEEITIPNRYSGGRGKTAHKLFDGIRTPRSRHKPMVDNVGSDAKIALVHALRKRIVTPMPMGRVSCVCGARVVMGTAPMIECAGCRTLHHLACNGISDHTPLAAQWWCPPCQAEAIAMSTSAHHTTPRAYTQLDERSSAFKGDYTNIALAPSPVMFPNTSFSQVAVAASTPLNRSMGSPTSRQHRSRILSYGTDMWSYVEDGPPSSVAPSTPGPSRPERFSTPRIDDAPFDVTSTPSRHLDFAFGQPSLFGLTPLGQGRRVTSGMLADGTPVASLGATFPRPRNVSGPMSDTIASRHDFLRDLNRGPQTEVPASPSTRWPHALLGAHNLSPSPFGHRRNVSGNKMSSVRSSSKSGLGYGVLEEKDDEM